MIFGNRDYTCMQYLQLIKLMVVDILFDLHQLDTLWVKKSTISIVFLFLRYFRFNIFKSSFLVLSFFLNHHNMIPIFLNVHDEWDEKKIHCYTLWINALIIRFVSTLAYTQHERYSVQLITLKFFLYIHIAYSST